MTAPDYSQQGAYDPNFQALVSGYGSGTAYTLTATQAAVALGTTNPLITLPAGRFLVFARAHWTYVGATFAAVKNIVFNLYRTNNTPGNITGATTTSIASIVTTLTGDGMYCVLPPTLYSATAGDILTLYGAVATLPSAGTVTVTEAEIVAVPLNS